MPKLLEMQALLSDLAPLRSFSMRDPLMMIP